MERRAIAGSGAMLRRTHEIENHKRADWTFSAGLRRVRGMGFLDSVTGFAGSVVKKIEHAAEGAGSIVKQIPAVVQQGVSQFEGTVDPILAGVSAALPGPFQSVEQGLVTRQLGQAFPPDAYRVSNDGLVWTIHPLNGGPDLQLRASDDRVSLSSGSTRVSVPLADGVIPGTHDVLGGVSAAIAQLDSSATTPQAQAQAAWRALQSQLGDPNTPGMYRDHAGGSGTAAVWPHGQVIAGALDNAIVNGDPSAATAALKALDQYAQGGAYAPSPNGSGHAQRFFDDNEWIGLDLLQAYSQTGDSAYLSKAENLFKFVQSGWSPKGGVLWEENAKQPTRNTCSNGPAEEMALRLYLATKDPKYLDFAKKVDAFLNSTLRTPDGLYADHVDDSGRVDGSIYSYNQGTPIGADVLMYRATGDTTYLDRAKQTAKAALAYFGQNDRLWKGAPCFNAIFFRNLMALDAVAPDPSYRQAVQGYLDRAWSQARDPNTGLFDQGGIGRYGADPGTAIDQSAFVQIAALLAMPKDKLLDVG